jgi:hypothetical protein
VIDKANLGLSRPDAAPSLAEVDVSGDGDIKFTLFPLPTRAPPQAVIDKANLGLSRPEAALLLVEADVSGDGEIDYNDFVPVGGQVRLDNRYVSPRFRFRFRPLPPTSYAATTTAAEPQLIPPAVATAATAPPPPFPPPPPPDGPLFALHPRPSIGFTPPSTRSHPNAPFHIVKSIDARDLSL